MNIDIQPLLANLVSFISLDQVVEIPQEYFNNTDILRLKDIKVLGQITKNADLELEAELKVNGTMVLEDAITLEPIDYHFNFEINDNIQEFVNNDQNTLDILELLWENIILEVPLKYTKETDLSKYQGDGWKLVSENNNIIDENNNPFKELLNQIEKE